MYEIVKYNNLKWALKLRVYIALMILKGGSFVFMQ